MRGFPDRPSGMRRAAGGSRAGRAASTAPARTIGGAVTAAARRLAQAGVPTPHADGRLLVQHALGVDRGGLLTERDRVLDADERARLRRAVDRRAAREPISRIVGVREFWSLEFRLSPAVLDPRPDSEAVVEAALSCVPDRTLPLSVLDLGTGSGCLLLALLHELPAAWGVGIDVDPDAVAVARDNARRLRLADRAAFLCSDWAAPLAGRFDLVVANPPYIGRLDRAELAPEVGVYDPPMALDGGSDGLAAYRRLSAGLDGLLPSGGHVVLEVGAGQADAVEELLRARGLVVRGRWLDLSGIDRSVIGEKVFGMRSQSE